MRPWHSGGEARGEATGGKPRDPQADGYHQHEDAEEAEQSALRQRSAVVIVGLLHERRALPAQSRLGRRRPLSQRAALLVQVEALLEEPAALGRAHAPAPDPVSQERI